MIKRPGEILVATDTLCGTVFRCIVFVSQKRRRKKKEKLNAGMLVAPHASRTVSNNNHQYKRRNFFNLFTAVQTNRNTVQ